MLSLIVCKVGIAVKKNYTLLKNSLTAIILYTEIIPSSLLSSSLPPFRLPSFLFSFFSFFLSTEKAYSSFSSLENLELILFINTLLLHGLNPRPSLYNILAKNYLNCLQKLLFESLFLSLFIAIFGCGSIFDQRLLFDHKQLCI